MGRTSIPTDINKKTCIMPQTIKHKGGSEETGKAKAYLISKLLSCSEQVYKTITLNVTIWDVGKSIPKWIMDVIIYILNVIATLKREP